MRKFDQIGLTKAVLWEEAKGKLRAIVAADGSEHSGTVIDDEFNYEKISRVVESFITEFEDNGYHE